MGGECTPKRLEQHRLQSRRRPVQMVSVVWGLLPVPGPSCARPTSGLCSGQGPAAQRRPEQPARGTASWVPFRFEVHAKVTRWVLESWPSLGQAALSSLGASDKRQLLTSSRPCDFPTPCHCPDAHLSSWSVSRLKTKVADQGPDVACRRVSCPAWCLYFF